MKVRKYGRPQPLRAEPHGLISSGDTAVIRSWSGP